MSNARNIAALSTVEVGATADQTKADLNAIGVSGGRKNLIINGGFDVWQRGDYATSPVIAVNSGYSADRWATWSELTSTQQSSTATINGKLKNTFKATASVASASSYLGINQRVETQNLPIGETITVSCWMKSNNSWSRLRQNSVAGTSADGPRHSGGGNWEFISWTMETTGTDPSTASVNFGVIMYNSTSVPISAGDYIEVADFQLELGSVATDFEHRSYGEELALCLRYYWKSPSNHFAFQYHSGYRMIEIFTPTRMRATPSVAYTANGTGTSWASYNHTPEKAAWYMLDNHTLDNNTYITNFSADAEL